MREIRCIIGAGSGIVANQLIRTIDLPLVGTFLRLLGVLLLLFFLFQNHLRSDGSILGFKGRLVPRPYVSLRQIKVGFGQHFLQTIQCLILTHVLGLVAHLVCGISQASYCF